jgi:Ser/Thr protein kinase RdoA (MazF antagonist)
MRRLTLRGGCDAGGTGPDIVKVVEGKDAGPIAARIAAVSDAVAWAGASFRVARVKACRAERGVFVQECLPGRQITGEIGSDGLEAPLQRIGAIHAGIHALHAAGPHVGALKDPWPTVVERLDWLAFIRPGYAEVFRAVAARLEAARPAPGEPVFCHGDFRCTQILADGENWSVIDFDDAGYGDASLDVGRFLAFLKYDVPALAGSQELLERAAAAYLDGYAGRAGRAPAPDALRWHRTSQEVLYLAQMVRRDLADEAAFAAGCAELDRLSARLRPGETR